MSANGWRKIHLVLTLVWCLFAIPTLLWWRESILWVAFMSLYANIGSHWSAFQASLGDQHVSNILAEVKKLREEVKELRKEAA